MNGAKFVARVGQLASGIVLAASVAGCASRPFFGQTAFIASYEPSNVFQEEASLPPEIRRVAVLPLNAVDTTSEMEFGRNTLEPVLAGELFRLRRFETVVLSAEQLRRVTGQSHWNSNERFAEDFFERLREELGVQAVLLPELTRYRAHEPLAIGWRLKLVDAAEPRILWAIDEVFDARDPMVAAAARRHAQNHPETASSLADERAILGSPRRFGRYTASAVVATLPPQRPGVASQNALKN
jgi:hypothetical protein